MPYRIHHAVVLGAGTMGAAIAAHLANVGIPSDLLDILPTSLSEDEQKRGLTLQSPEVRNRVVRQGFERCLKARPANLYHPDLARLVRLGNFEDDFDRVGQADWIIEAVVERVDIKQPLMKRVDEIRRPESIVSTNTSGIPVHQIADGRSAGFRKHFLGTHFFNPPRYLQLLELIPTDETDPELVAFLRGFCEDRLGKGVVVCKDTPNFIANRILSIAGSIALNHALAQGYTVERSARSPAGDRAAEDGHVPAQRSGGDRRPGARLAELVSGHPGRPVPGRAGRFKGGGAGGGDERTRLAGQQGGGRVLQEGRGGGRPRILGPRPEFVGASPTGQGEFPVLVAIAFDRKTRQRLAELAYAGDAAGLSVRRILSRLVVYAAACARDRADLSRSTRHAAGDFSGSSVRSGTWGTLGVRPLGRPAEAEQVPIPAWVETMLAAAAKRSIDRMVGRDGSL
jgi:3-hydroxyacyl-CoA dehydrogenase